MSAKANSEELSDMLSPQGPGNQADFYPSITKVEDPRIYALTELDDLSRAHAVIEPHECSGPQWSGASD